MKNILPFFFLIIVCASCATQPLELTFTPASSKYFDYQGRTDTTDNEGVILITSAASASFSTLGDSVVLHVKAGGSLHNYLVLVINDEYRGRMEILPGSIQKIPLKLPNKKNNTIEIIKATEAANDVVIFYGVESFGLDLPVPNSKPFIEFIGNSITCGYGVDESSVPCGEGLWFDQHNAYLAYGPQVAKALDVNYILNSVSGIGMYRNWNDENILEPIMPQVYDNLYLNLDSSQRYQPTHKPNIVSICLGTNDLSHGDGTKARLPFNSEKYIENYIDFVSKIYARYPDTNVALLSSPMASEADVEVLNTCLEEVKQHFEANHVIEIFKFSNVSALGCDAHPGEKDQENMAQQLIPFYKQLLMK